MRLNKFTLILSFILLCTFIFQSGCEEQQTRRERLDPAWFNQPVWDQVRASSGQNTPAPVQEVPVVNNVQNKQLPQIKFDKMSHDFGQIGSGSKNNVCEFVFTNVGNANLEISAPKTSCDCTPVILENDKRIYAPGESGRIIVGYYDTELGTAIKHINLSSNDPVNPSAQLSIKATLVAPIDYEPKKIELSMIAENNGNCPPITIRSLDGKPFSISGFESSSNFLTVNFNPNQKATQFTLQPKVNMELLAAAPEGNYRINITHPDCKVVSGSFYTPPRFAISPRKLTVKNADPSKTIVKTINVTSNYGEDFDVKASLPRSSFMTVKETMKTRNGYQVTVEINPPPARNNAKMFSDNISITLPGIETYTLECNGYYPGVVAPSASEDEECKTCGIKRLDNPGMSQNPR